MPNKIPISAAKRFAEDQQCTQVIIVAWDGACEHVVTYGKSVIDCDQAAQGGNFVKKALGWDEHLWHTEPSRVKKMKEKIKDLETQLQWYKDQAAKDFNRNLT